MDVGAHLFFSVQYFWANIPTAFADLLSCDTLKQHSKQHIHLYWYTVHYRNKVMNKTILMDKQLNIKWTLMFNCLLTFTIVIFFYYPTHAIK